MFEQYPNEKYKMNCTFVYGIFKRHKQIKALKNYLQTEIDKAEMDLQKAAATLGR